MKSLKTPLRYPGGKSRAITKLFQFIPDLSPYTFYVEPFLGGGSVAIEVTKRYPNISVIVGDLYEPLINFWMVLQKNSNELTHFLKSLKNEHPDPVSAKKLFADKKSVLNDLTGDNVVRASAFYILNKCSFSGLTEASSFSSQASESNFTMRGIEKLPEYSKIIEKWEIFHLPYDRLINNDPSGFLYLDPPYDIKDNLYGSKGSMHKQFDHNVFSKYCESVGMDTLISYNSDQLVKDRFKDWKTAEFDHTYTMRSVGDYMKNQNTRKELVLFNYMMPGDEVTL